MLFLADHIMFCVFYLAAVTEAKVWVLDRRVYQLVMKRSGLKRHEDNIAFLQSVPLFHNLTKDHLSRIADALQLVSNNL